MIRVLDKGFWKDALIGSFEFDLSFIYFKKDHVLLHQWIALSNPNSEDYSKITGYLKLSISVACTGDEQVQIEEDDSDPKDVIVMMPPQLNPKFYQLKFRFYKAEKIPAMDMGIKFVRKAKTDAYMLMVYKNRKLKTKVKEIEEDGPGIEWNQEFWLPAQIPIIQPRIVIKLMDEDDVNDEVVGSLLFDLKEIIDECSAGRGGVFNWKNIYGSPMNQSNSQFKKAMNENPELASNWKGRILMQVLCEETEKPIVKV